ncbi:MAG TPA: transposase [Bryobacteraceae bacterium]|nr:transposase [Bryobacteraceae bacterium]
MSQDAYELDHNGRAEVMKALEEVCSNRSWRLLAAHIRTEHLHLVVDAEERPERVMTTLKAYASRRLNRVETGDASRRRWARHGSTRWLWTSEAISAAVRYVLEEQGAPMEVFHENTAP